MRNINESLRGRPLIDGNLHWTKAAFTRWTINLESLKENSQLSGFLSFSSFFSIAPRRNEAGKRERMKKKRIHNR